MITTTHERHAANRAMRYIRNKFRKGVRPPSHIIEKMDTGRPEIRRRVAAEVAKQKKAEQPKEVFLG